MTVSEAMRFSALKKWGGFEDGEKNAGSTNWPKSDIGRYHGDSDWK